MNNDLISREALKKALKDAHINMKLTFDIATFNCVMNTIDNAPTVETSKIEYKAYNDGFKDGVDQGIKLSERPQGKWIYHRAQGEFLPYMECDNCHEEFLLNMLRPAEFRKVNRFCSNCGADMREGGKL